MLPKLELLEGSSAPLTHQKGAPTLIWIMAQARHDIKDKRLKGDLACQNERYCIPRSVAMIGKRKAETLPANWRWAGGMPSVEATSSSRHSEDERGASGAEKDLAQPQEALELARAGAFDVFVTRELDLCWSKMLIRSRIVTHTLVLW